MSFFKQTLANWGSCWAAYRPAIPGTARLALLGFSGLSAVIIVASEYQKGQSQALVNFKKSRLAMVGLLI
jgi:hypothetical protein